VSRTPVREAFRRLQSEGIIEPKDGGLRVTSFDMRAVAELYDVRQTLEGSAAALAARWADSTELALLLSLLKALQAQRDALVLLGPSTLLTPERTAAAHAEHVEIIAAIVAHDAPRAEAAARQHIRAGYEARVRAMAEQLQENAEYPSPLFDLHHYAENQAFLPMNTVADLEKAANNDNRKETVL
jgi:DNA-binding GntR family transcriptional regulator